MKSNSINPFKMINKSGLRSFTIIWLGQTISVLGSDMSGFAMTLWLWDATGKVTPMVFMSLLRLIVVILLMPIAGSIVDRFNRKTILILSDSWGAIVTTISLVLIFSGKMSVMIVYIAGFLNQVFNVFHNIANEAMKVQVVPKEQLGRAAGMTSFSDSFSGVISPVITAALIPFIGYAGIFLIDLFTFGFAFMMICMVRVPNLKMPNQLRKNIFQDIADGYKYLLSNKILKLIVINGTLASFFFQFGNLASIPMLLARVGDDTLTYGYVRAIWSIAGIAGAVVLSVWGGPKKRRYLISIIFTLGYAIGITIVGLGRNFIAWAIGGMIWYFSAALSGIKSAFFATKVPLYMQGRFYAVRQSIGSIFGIIPYIFVGVLADNIFEPMMTNQLFSSKLSWLVGTGKGSGMGLLIVISGILTFVVLLSSLLIKHIREADVLLDDCVQDN